MNKADKCTLNIRSRANGSKGAQISLGAQRVKELFSKAENQERATAHLAAGQMPEPSVTFPSFHQRRWVGEKPQEGGSVIGSSPVDMWFVDHLWENHPEVLS